jgi:hypothetical protein
MNLDIRLPMGIMFALFGAAMTVWGVMTYSNKEMYEASLGINVNVCWGSFLLLFGCGMIALARRAMKRPAGSGPAA